MSDEDVIAYLVSNGGERIPISYKALGTSTTLQNLCDATNTYANLLDYYTRAASGDNTVGDVSEFDIPIDADARTLECVVRYMEHIKNEPPMTVPPAVGILPPPQMDDYDREFLSYSRYVKNDVDRYDMCMTVMLLAIYLDVTKLIHINAYTIANGIKNMNVEDIRRLFHTFSDFTDEEIAQMKEENKWIYNKK